jgi:hypothetical protein
MSELSRDDVLAIVHPLDDATIAEIIATGASPEEFKQAAAVFDREKKTHEHRALPPGRVGRVISILERVALTRPRSRFGEGGSTME